MHDNSTRLGVVALPVYGSLVFLSTLRSSGWQSGWPSQLVRCCCVGFDRGALTDRLRERRPGQSP
jgi:hypothetical protein